MRKKKAFDMWDFAILALLAASFYIQWYGLTWTNPTHTQQFLFNLSDQIWGWLIGGFVLKKLLDRGEK